VALPKDMAEREIRAILPSSDKIFALTQWTTGEGDNPTLYVYDVKARKWSKAGTVACPSFETIRVETHQLVFKCVEKSKTLSAGALTLPMTGDLAIPQKSAEAPSVQASLQGDEFEWDSLLIKSAGKSSTLRAAQLAR
jgi:hypothetical protein